MILPNNKLVLPLNIRLIIQFNIIFEFCPWDMSKWKGTVLIYRHALSSLPSYSKHCNTLSFLILCSAMDNAHFYAQTFERKIRMHIIHG